MANERTYTFNFPNINFNALVQQQCDQALDILGMDIVFLPLEEYDKHEIGSIFEELHAKNYEHAYRMRVALEDAVFFQGNHDLYGKFGLQIQDEVVFWVSRFSFHERITGEKFNFVEGAQLQPDYLNNALVHPKISDLVYFPMYDSLFEVSFVEDDEKLVLGHRAFWKIICKKYKVDLNENIDVGSTGMGQPLDPGAQGNLADLISILDGIDDSERSKLIDIYMGYGETGTTGETAHDPKDTEIKNDDIQKDAADNEGLPPVDPFSNF